MCEEKTRRFTGSTSNQIWICDQPQDGPGARSHCAPLRYYRRSYRI